MADDLGELRPSRFGEVKSQLIIAIITTMLSPALAVSAPLTFNTATPVATGEYVFRGLAVINRSGTDPGGANRDRTVSAGVMALGYGVTGKLALFGVLPYLDKQLDFDAQQGRATRKASGLGDLSLFARYTFYQRDGVGRSFRVAPFAGVELPTGEGQEHDALGRVPSVLQPGSGAIDGFAGLISTYQSLDYQIDGQLAYRRNGEANGFQAGDEWRLDGSLQYRLWPGTLTTGVPAFLYTVLEAGLKYRSKDEVGGADNPNSGGTTIAITPGLQYVTRRWIIEGAVEIPVLQNLNGLALETDYVVRAGFRVNF